MASRRKPSSPGSLLRRSCMSRALASRARFRTPNCCSSSSSNTGTPHRSRAVYRSDAPGALTVTGADLVAHLDLESLLAALDIVHSPMMHLLHVMAGGFHVLMAVLADHRHGLSMGGVSAQQRCREGVPLPLHCFPPGMTVSLRMTGGRSGGGRLVASRLVNRALHFGSCWPVGRSYGRDFLG